MKTCKAKSGKEFKAAFSLDGDGKISFRFDTPRKQGKPVLKEAGQEADHGNPAV
jgi:hypothetical protein